MWELTLFGSKLDKMIFYPYILLFEVTGKRKFDRLMRTQKYDFLAKKHDN